MLKLARSVVSVLGRRFRSRATLELEKVNDPTATLTTSIHTVELCHIGVGGAFMAVNPKPLDFSLLFGVLGKHSRRSPSLV
jgi:hypothetical protein